MKCLYCSSDTKYKDRQTNGGACGSCKHPFAFEPKTTLVGMVAIADGLFERVLKDASAEGTVFFTERQLWFEFSRRVLRKTWGSLTGTGAMLFGGSIAIGLMASFALSTFWPALVLGVVGGIAGVKESQRKRKTMAPTPPISFEDFERRFLKRWVQVHGKPKWLVEPEAPRTGKRTADPEPDLTAYSFDRAVITERDDTAAMLIANKFHFENNCAILSTQRYPSAIAATVLEMLRRNPKLKVFVVHDASPEGCGIPLQMRDEKWFPETSIQVVDLGLRPKHAVDLKLFAVNGGARALDPALKQAFPAEESEWLEAGNRSELSSLRSAKLMRSIYQGFARVNQAEAAGDAWVDGGGGGGFIWIHDSGADLHAADSFG